MAFSNRTPDYKQRISLTPQEAEIVMGYHAAHSQEGSAGNKLFKFISDNGAGQWPIVLEADPNSEALHLGLTTIGQAGVDIEIEGDIGVPKIVELTTESYTIE